ncbi:hypothetical protein N7494_004475 [Penicillium frequentans]|uniref:Uncharacterized protein n=1 Tax=Penicillium frequentans TaxID=3151616 RepID=A0AAD6D0Q2_9EURO|nr:hypothetical protein N7494_004475 [Penicillium glabrum]
MTARTLLRQRERGIQNLNQLTALNVRKVTRFRKEGIEALETAISNLKIANKKESVSKETPAEETASR